MSEHNVKVEGVELEPDLTYSEYPHFGLWLNAECISSLYHNPPFYRIIKADVVAVRLVNAFFYCHVTWFP